MSFQKNKSKSKKQTRYESYVKHEIENCCEKSAKKCEKAATANGLSCQFLKSLLAYFLFCFTVPILLQWFDNLFVVLLYVWTIFLMFDFWRSRYN